MTRRTVFTETLMHLARSWLRIWLGPSPGCFFHSPRISLSRCSSISTAAGPLLGDGPSPPPGFATLSLGFGLGPAGRLAQLPSVLSGMPCFAAAFSRPSTFTSATAASCCSRVYVWYDPRFPPHSSFLCLSCFFLPIGDRPATERPPPAPNRPGFQAQVTVVVVRQEHVVRAGRSRYRAGMRCSRSRRR